jgi:hypothetical protein
MSTSGLRHALLSPRALKWGGLAVGLMLIGLGGVAHFCDTRLRAAATPNDLFALEALTLLSDPQLRTRLIRTADADYQYNCHGWTFTRGEREVDMDEVARRLEEEYRPTTQPKLGDIVVYRNHLGDIMHSGVVKAVGEEGFVLVESKWGTAGRFIHEPTISRTFASFSYYEKAPAVVKKKAPREAEAETLEAVCE